jgi:mono/diheme cytochrome c family protein
VPPPAAPPVGAKAKPLWKKRCGSRHGADGAGWAARPPRSLSAGEKREIIATGKDKMPAFGKKLKPAQLDLLTAYSAKLAEARRAKAR